MGDPHPLPNVFSVSWFLLKRVKKRLVSWFADPEPMKTVGLGFVV